MEHREPSRQLFESVFQSLDLAVLVRPQTEKPQTFELASPPPPWFTEVFRSPNHMEECSPFLSDFIEGTARESWNGNEARTPSGLWTEEVNGELHHFEATAIAQNNSEVLIIEAANNRHDREQAHLHYAHEIALQQRRLDKERQRKEILLDCIVHELSSPLSTILMNLQFVENQIQQPKLRSALSRAEAQAKQQRDLIHSISHTFRTELSPFEASLLSNPQGSDLLTLAQAATNSFRDEFPDAQFLLTHFPKSPAPHDFEVLAEHTRLSGVLKNLFDYAYHRSSKDSAIELQLHSSTDSVTCSIRHRSNSPGTLKDPDPFQLFSTPQRSTSTPAQPSTEAPRPEQIGLHFCKMMIEHWGGTIGSEALPEQGHHLWFRLRRHVSSQEAI